MTEDLVAHLGYVGFFLVLVLGGVGLPVPEEVPIILAAVLSRKETIWWPIAFASCLLGVLVGDFVVYFIGYFYGEKVLSLRFTRKFLTKARETQIKGYFHRHGIKILILGRFAVGFRTAAYLTAGILKLPALNLFLTDLCAATFSTTLMFGIGYLFAFQIENATDKIQRWQHAIVWGIALAVAFWLIHRFYKFYKGRQRTGQVVGPPVLVDDRPLPVDDLHSGTFSTEAAIAAATRETDPIPCDDSPVIIPEVIAVIDEPLVSVEAKAETIGFAPSGVSSADLSKNQVDPNRDP